MPEGSPFSSAVSASRLPRYQVGPVAFSRTHFGNLVASLESFFKEPSSANYVCVSNVHTTVECRADRLLRSIQNDSFLTIADGQPIVLYGRIRGVNGIQRIMGPDIMTQVFAAPECGQRRHYFLGGAPETLAKMERNLLARFPRLRIAGMYSPPFRKLTADEESGMRKAILDAKPDYLWVCFGAPKQEYWMQANHAAYPGILLIGIGAGFAYHAGELKRAPVWAQKLACEWLWRLAQDPKRLWKRYLKTNPIFVGMLLKALVGRLFGKTASPGAGGTPTG